MIPVTVLMTLALNLAASFTRLRAQGAEVHEAGESDGPEFLGVDNVATVELGGLALATASEHGKQRVHQKTIG